MKAKIGSVVFGKPGADALGAAAGLQGGKPCGAVVIGGRLDSREVMIVLSSAEAIAFASTIVAACAAADGHQVQGVELESESSAAPLNGARG